MLPPETHRAMKYITDKEVRKGAGVAFSNSYIFASSKGSASHASGWNCINNILVKLQKKGALNATKNRHYVVTLLLFCLAVMN